jgi:hypothetical protein
MIESRKDDDILRIPSTRPLARSEAARAADAADASEGIAGTAAADGAPAVDPAAAVDGPGAMGGPEAIADALATGAIDSDEARAALIAEAVRAHLPADADPILVSRIRADVEAILADDPTLAELLRRR